MIINLSGCKFSEEDIIIVDFSCEYPVLDLKLSDIAEISYIPLQGMDSVKLLSSRTSYENLIYIDDEHIFIGDFAPYKKDGEWHRFNPRYGKLMRFDAGGSYINTVFKAHNENESILFGLQTPYEIDKDKKEVYAFSAYGKFIRKFGYNGEIIANSGTLSKGYKYAGRFGDTLALFDLHSQIVLMNGELRDNGETIFLYNTCTGQFCPYKGLQFARPYGLNDISSSSNGIIHTADGIYISSQRSDTVYHINRKLEISPKFLSVQQSDDAVNLVYPLVETEDYILFCNDQDYNSLRKKRFTNSNYIYLKKDKQIYQLPCSNHFPEEDEEILWKDEFLLNSRFLTKNSNILASVLPIPFLKENYNILPDELKCIADASSEDDSPVLMVMRFGKYSVDF